MRCLPLTVAWFLSITLAAQDPRLELDGQKLAEPAATISPLGWVELRGRRDGGAVFVAKLRFALLEWPTVGEHQLGKTFELQVSDDPTKAGDVVTGSCTVEACGLERVRLQTTFDRGGNAHRLAVDLVPQLYTPKWQPEVSGTFPAPTDQPNFDDVVFCAIANCGTGLPGQRQVAESIASLASSGPLDFAMVAGNVFLPSGVKDGTDPLFETRFEKVYDSNRLAVPFYIVPGPADLRGSVDAMVRYGAVRQRWAAHPEAFSQEFTSRGKKLAVFCGNSEWMAGDIPNPRTRSAIRNLLDVARDSKADWKIVMTHGQLLSAGDAGEPARQKSLDDRSRYHLVNGKVDLLVHGDARAMRMVVRKGEIPQVLAGGGGGPEVGQVPATPPGTVFAYGGGGFVWFRFDGKKLQVSFRDAAGKVLYVHELTKP